MLNNIENISVFKNLNRINEMKKRQSVLPISLQSCMCKGLITSDEAALKTGVYSPDLYDNEMVKLIHSKTTFLNNQDSVSSLSELYNPKNETEFTIPYSDFVKIISQIDRQILIWTIFSSTYSTLGQVQVRCSECDHTFTDKKITPEEIFQEDTIVPWDKDTEWYNYTIVVPFVIEIEGIYKLEYEISLLSIDKYMSVLRLMNQDLIATNSRRYNKIFSKPEELAAIIKSIKIYKTETDINPDVFDSANIIYKHSCDLNPDIADQIIDKYNEEFGRYVPKFYKTYICTECNKEFNSNFNMETMLYQRFFRL